jgi:hypothetical protein
MGRLHAQVEKVLCINVGYRINSVYHTIHNGTGTLNRPPLATRWICRVNFPLLSAATIKRGVNLTALSDHDFLQRHDLGRARLRGILVAKRRAERHHRFALRFDTPPSVLVRSSSFQ